jgi:AraC family transcriptional regulator
VPASGEEARDFPVYCRRYVSSLPNAPLHDVVVELFLPLK